MEKEKSAFFKGWLRFWSFLSSLFCDQAGSMSQKRVIPLGAFILFWKVVSKNIENPSFTIDSNLLWTLIIIILGGIGLSLPEWFAPKKT
jgi:hypothetical protein